MTEIHLRGAAELAEAIRRRHIGSRELLEQFVQRIGRIDPAVNAVVTLDLERARAAADAADRAAAHGEFAGPLHGLPITIKDNFETAGMRSTNGAKTYANHVPARHAVAVQRLVDAGAIVFGKTNTPPFAADIQTYNDLFGVTKNPWDPTRTPGGSSGGAAAAVALGFTAFELGSDIGGSIRIPAHNCGVYGHKSTYGIVPARGMLWGRPGTLSAEDISVPGPLARKAEDLAWLLEVLAGPLPEEAVGWRLSLPPPRRERLGDYRVGVWIEEADFPLDHAVAGVLREAVEALRRAGAHVDEAARPGFALRDAFEAFLRLLWPVTTANVPDAVFDLIRRRAGEAAPEDRSPRARHARISTMTHREWIHANEVRERYRAAWREFFTRYDVLLTPVSPVCAIPHDHNPDALSRTITMNGETRWYWEQQVWISLAGLSYLPATVAPVGRAGNLPVGVQIIGPYLEDRTTIDFAKQMADVVGGFEPPPGYE